ncbi:hypothetical protein TVAG_311340 [Trichomonas vaginalis G3]|uniref:Uncharacterized protein n=1 Tax=Trichomonas vaginalis (strain ATCC PRA-98 / G3) TaxID=412133 RepID=A2FX60_TRIV3|nr:armadillo (ARM) repeat-containing protein family [Trichomonas vaginalis G3]EAX90506.1 hypothetical protein TVAG_311340 [Trichomonas vaginalis G3]KAI5553549.1 armadillo (ARM) repeat-containing protein family [Trichomonas vaginalis G3]|eukprot:XP_001303436.1 hypothetical protein [Trichomonas vaginalis G3]
MSHSVKDYKPDLNDNIDPNTIDEEIRDTELKNNEKLIQNEKIQIQNHFEDLISKLELEDSNLSLLFRIDWTSTRLKSASIDDILQTYEIPGKIIQLLQYPSTPIVEVTLRITNHLCRISNILLQFMYENIRLYYKLIRAPVLFPLVAELIDGMIRRFPNIAPNFIQKEVNIVHVLTELIEVMHPKGKLISAYLIYSIIRHLDSKNFDDFQSIVIEPLSIVKYLLSSQNTIIEEGDLAPIIDLLAELILFYSGDIHLIITDDNFEKILDLTLNWPTKESEGVLFGSLLKFWSILLFEFTDQFIDLGIQKDLIQAAVDTFDHPMCPKSRAIYFLSNLAAIENFAPDIIESNAFDCVYSFNEDYNQYEVEIMAFFFMNCLNTAKDAVVSKDYFEDMLHICFDLYDNAKSSHFNLLFMKSIEILLKFDDSFKSMIDFDQALDIFYNAQSSENEEIAQIATNIINEYFPDYK